MALTERLRKAANCVGFLDGAPEPAADLAATLIQAADEIDRLRAKHIQFVKLIDDQLGTPCEQVRHEQEVENLRAALKALVDDVLEYERINNLSPNPGKRDCWQSVTQAKAVLGIKTLAANGEEMPAGSAGTTIINDGRPT